MTRFILALAFVLTAGHAAASPRSAHAEELARATGAPVPAGRWQIALGVALGLADYAERGIGLEDVWSGGVSVGASARIVPRTHLGLELEGRFLGLEDAPGSTVGNPPVEQTTYGAVYGFAPAAGLSHVVPLGTSPLALALVGRLGDLTERYVRPTITRMGETGRTERVAVGPRRRSGLLLALAAGLDFTIGEKGNARLEAGWTMAYFPRASDGILVRTPAGARHEATLRFSLLYDVVQRRRRR